MLYRCRNQNIDVIITRRIFIETGRCQFEQSKACMVIHTLMSLIFQNTSKFLLDTIMISFVNLTRERTTISTKIRYFSFITLRTL